MSENIRTQGITRGQTEVRISKFGPFLEQAYIARAIDLPINYGKDRIVAMVRDPWWIFVYWEITPARENAVKEKITAEKQDINRSILRVYDVTGVNKFDGKNANNYFDITLKDMARNWYIEVPKPGTSWCVEIGTLSKKGDFYALARSNVARVPRFGVSERSDKTWMLSEEEYFKLFGASCGFDMSGKSSLEIRESFKRYLKEWTSSGGVSSFSSSNF